MHSVKPMVGGHEPLSFVPIPRSTMPESGTWDLGLEEEDVPEDLKYYRMESGKKKNNPRRHLEQEDYVGAVPTPPCSPILFGPQDLVRESSRSRASVCSGRGGRTRDLPEELNEREQRRRAVEQESWASEVERERAIEKKMREAMKKGEERSVRGPEQMEVDKEMPKYKVKKSGIIFKEGIQEISTDPVLDPPPYTCFNCWKRGHRATECPDPFQPHCNNCGRKKVYLDTCPRCGPTRANFWTTGGRREKEARRE